MKFSALIRVELGRVFRNRQTWLVSALTALAPLTGYQVFRTTIGDSMAARYLANPLLAGGIAGTLCFAILMLSTLDKPLRNGMDALTDAVVHPVTLCVARFLAVLTAGMAATALIGLLYLPYTAWKLNIAFSLSDYVLAVLLFLLSGPVMGTLAAAICWQLTKRLDVSLVAILAALIVSRSSICRDSFLLQWSVPLVPTLSDAFGSAIVWRTACYSRLVWLCLLGGAWLLSLLCVRQYGKGLWGSFFRHARKISLPVLAAALFFCGGLLWQRQPFVDHTPAKWQELMETEPDRSNKALMLRRTELNVKIDSYTLGTMSGTANYHLQNASGAPQDLYFELNTGYTVRSVTANGRPIKWKDLKNDLIASREMCCVLPADAEIDLQVNYGGMAQMWNQMEYALDANVISDRNVTMTSKTLAPVVSGCVLVADDANITLYVDLKNGLIPVGTGALTKLADNTGKTASWRMEDTGTDRLFLYAGDYICKEIDAGNGTSIPFYYSQRYQSRLENGALDLMEQAVQYCTEHYGAKGNSDGAFQIVQTTAFNFGGFAVGNISGMGESYFSDDNLNDPDKGPDSAEILAHEIIHQWWGLSAQLMDMEDSAWNSEGITVYTTYRLMCRIKGEEYARENYVDKWKSTMNNLHASFYQRNPAYVDRLPERYQADIRATADGANWYDGNALMICRAAQIIGEDELDAVWARLFLEGGTEVPSYISVNDFLAACGLEKGAVGRE
ncbi:hypothetical protein [Oscillibacter sp.]|uniref:hypothetical protein n=1 Tax=Oscillibacter sp. TaxID=1945593 RepID=UPI0028AB6A5D|nr:hypothetical protein [Oscillibacter sp.]